MTNKPKLVYESKAKPNYVASEQAGAREGARNNAQADIKGQTHDANGNKVAIAWNNLTDAGRVVVTAGAALLIAGGAAKLASAGNQAPEQRHTVVRDVNYLKLAPQEVAPATPFGKGGEWVAQQLNGNRLKGQALIDEGKSVESYGSTIEPDGSHELAPGDTPEVPILSDHDIDLINSMNAADPASVPNFGLNQGR